MTDSRTPAELARVVEAGLGNSYVTMAEAVDALAELQAQAEAGEIIREAARAQAMRERWLGHPESVERAERLEAALAAAVPSPADQRTPTYAEEQLAEIARREGVTGRPGGSVNTGARTGSK